MCRPIRSIKELRDRVGSVKNTKKITSAMKLVAAAKVIRAAASRRPSLRAGRWGVGVGVV